MIVCIAIGAAIIGACVLWLINISQQPVKHSNNGLINTEGLGEAIDSILAYAVIAVGIAVIVVAALWEIPALRRPLKILFVCGIIAAIATLSHRCG